MNLQEPWCAHLFHGCEHFRVAVDDDCNGENEAEQCVEDEIAVVAPRPLLPRQGAGSLNSLRAVGAPPEQRSHSPEQAEGPDQQEPDDASPHPQL